MRRLIFTTAFATLAIAGTLPALAQPALPAVVSQNPVDFTPHALDGMVSALALVGDEVVVGGTFTQVQTADRTHTLTRKYLFAYNLTTGAISNFAPDVDNKVESLAPGPNNTVYVGGAFKHINGTAQRGIAQIDVGTGQRVGGFTASIDYGDVRTLGSYNGQLYLGGSFGAVDGKSVKALARVDGQTGAVDTSFNVGLDSPNLGRTKVDKLTISPGGQRLVAVGAIESAGGQPRTQIVMVDLPGGQVDPWFTTVYQGKCYASFETYMRGVDFSPDGNYFVVVTTGKLNSPTLMCDTAARFETTGTGAHNPSWVNRTGGDSLFAVVVTGPAVYVGGHERWLDNPQGQKTAGPGAVSRQGIGAIDPVTGHALAWNPTRTRGVGVQAFLSTRAGLIVGSDTDELGHEYHGRLGMFPLG
jgi:hypothetical protein